MAKAKAKVTQTVEKVPTVKAPLKNKVIKLYNEIEADSTKIIQKAIELGEALVEAKQIIGHGGFMKYVTEELGLNFKRVQRAIDIYNYQPRITTENPETLSEALQIANTAKREEKKARDEKELKMFKEYRPEFEDYTAELESASSAKDALKIEKPAEPWADEEDARNIGNRFKSWVKKEEAKAQKEAEKELEESEESPLDLDQLIEDAYQQAMLIIGRLDPYEQDNAVDLLIARLQRGDSLV